MWRQKLISRFLRSLEKLDYGTMQLTTPNGKTHYFQGNEPGPKAICTLHDWRVIPTFISKGHIGLTESYRDNLWDTTCLPTFLIVGLKNERNLSHFLNGNFISKLSSRIQYLFNANTLKGSRRNIQAHYDLGNDFYQLWLDESMTYSSALFSHEAESLVTAQMNKYDRLLNRLHHNSGRLLEVGCGWGGFGKRAIARGNLDYKGITLSKEQQRYAQTVVPDPNSIVLEDYRAQTGKFDHIVSIEMFEAVGEHFWPVYFKQLKSLLSKNGKALIQTITIKNELFDRYRCNGDMIRSFIFPGGMLPSPQRFEQEVKKAGLKLNDTFCFGQDYAKTLQLWLKKFDEKKSAIETLGYDDKFVRIWRMYLAACIAGFTTGRTDVMQIELSHAS